MPLWGGVGPQAQGALVCNWGNAASPTKDTRNHLVPSNVQLTTRHNLLPSLESSLRVDHQLLSLPLSSSYQFHNGACEIIYWWQGHVLGHPAYL